MMMLLLLMWSNCASCFKFHLICLKKYFSVPCFPEMNFAECPQIKANYFLSIICFSININIRCITLKSTYVTAQTYLKHV